MINIALIPARGGSKSIKKKNIIRLGGYPLIYYAINAAQNTE
jgi:N-acylneuraminate cytidylyltransferase